MAFITLPGATATDAVSLIGTSGEDIASVTTQVSGLFLDAKEENDLVTFSEAGVDYNARGMSGDDNFTANATLTNSILNGNVGDDTLSADTIINTALYGGKGIDTIDVESLTDKSSIYGNIGNDVITVTSGLAASNVYGGKNADTISIGGEINASGIFGDLGNDAINLTSADLNASSSVNGGQDDDVITLTGVNTFAASASVFGGQGNDTINGVNSVGNQNIFGDLDNDTITTGVGSDNLRGGAGADSLTSGNGNNTLTGDAGADVINLTQTVELRDTLNYAAGDTTVAIGGAGNTGTIAGFDDITQFNVANNGAATKDVLDFAGTASLVGNTGGVNATDSTLTIGGVALKSYAVTNGLATFDDADAYAGAVALTGNAGIAAAVQLLLANDIGAAGATLTFAEAGGGAASFVYSQLAATAGGVGGYNLVRLTGETVTTLSTTLTDNTAAQVLIA